MSIIEKSVHDIFGNKLIKKEYINKLRSKYNIPHYIIENILYKSLSSSNSPNENLSNFDRFYDIVKDKLVNPKKNQIIQSGIRTKRSKVIIDKLNVRYYQSHKRYLADFLNLGVGKVLIGEDIVNKHTSLLEKEQWCEVKVRFLENDENFEFTIDELFLLEDNSVNLQYYINYVEEMNTDEWLNLIFKSIGLEIEQFSKRQRYLLLVRLIPFVEKNYNLIELGYRGTGKSFLYRQMTNDSILVSGGKTTIANLFYNMGIKQIGLIGSKNVVAFDEVAHVDFKDNTAIQIMKDYMESGSFSRGKHDIFADSSIVFLGNINEDIKLLLNKNVFDPLPELLQDTALIDRLNFYLPGWEFNKLTADSITSGLGLLTSYLFSAFNKLREFDYTEIVSDYFQFEGDLDTRDIKSIKKTISGYIKLIHPGGNVPGEKLKDYLELALEGRKRIKDYLSKYYSFEYTEQLFECTAIESDEKIIPSLPEDNFNYHLKQKVPEPGVIYIGQIIDNNDLAILKIKIKSYSHGKGRLNFVNTYIEEIMKQVKRSFVNIKGKSTELRNTMNSLDFYIEFIPLLNEISADISKVFFIALYSLINKKVITTSFIITEKSKLFRQSLNSFSTKAIKIEEDGKIKTLLPIKTDDINMYIEIPREVYENVHDFIILAD